MKTVEYRKLYTSLFNTVTVAIELLQRDYPDTARMMLIKAQQQAEELYISAGERAKKDAQRQRITVADAVR